MEPNKATLEKDLQMLDSVQSYLKHHASPHEPWTAEAIAVLDYAKITVGKQVPKQPVQGEWCIAKCPSCGGELGEWLEDGYHKDWDHMTVCACGQQLTWDRD